MGKGRPLVRETKSDVRIYGNFTRKLYGIIAGEAGKLSVSEPEILRKCVEAALLPSILSDIFEEAVRARDATGLLRAAQAAKASEAKAAQYVRAVRYQKARIDKALEILAVEIHPEEAQDRQEIASVKA